MPRTFIQRFQTIDRLIQKKQAGTAKQLAKRLDISERTAKEFITIIKEFGAVAKRFLGPIGVTIAVASFGLCLGDWLP